MDADLAGEDQDLMFFTSGENIDNLLPDVCEDIRRRSECVGWQETYFQYHLRLQF